MDPTFEQEKSPADQATREREALVAKTAAEYLEKIRTQDPVALAHQLAEEKVRLEEENAILKENADHDILNPDILSEDGFHRHLGDRLREKGREIHQLQLGGEEIPTRLPGVMAYIDLDAFKDVNESLGHDMGDVALNVIGQLIASEVRPADLVARLHGDEFGIYLDNIEDMEVAIHIVERIRDTLLSNFPLLMGPELSASIGLVRLPEGNVLEQVGSADSRKSLTTNTQAVADTVHRRGAKHSGKNRIGVQLDDGSVKTAVLTPNPNDPAGRTAITYIEPKMIFQM